MSVECATSRSRHVLGRKPAQNGHSRVRVASRDPSRRRHRSSNAHSSRTARSQRRESRHSPPRKRLPIRAYFRRQNRFGLSFKYEVVRFSVDLIDLYLIVECAIGDTSLKRPRLFSTILSRRCHLMSTMSMCSIDSILYRICPRLRLFRPFFSLSSLNSSSSSASSPSISSR